MVSSRRVFIIEDDESMRRALTALLESEGLETETFASAEDFLGAQRGAAGCAVVDLRLPGMSGLDLQKALARKGSPLAVVIITGHGDVRTAVAALKAGALHFIEKPFDPRELLELVGEALSAAAQRSKDYDENNELVARYELLTPREREVMRRVTEGLPTKSVAIEFNISPRTVENHRASIMEKMGAKNLSTLVRFGITLDAVLQKRTS